jgi:integrase
MHHNRITPQSQADVHVLDQIDVFFPKLCIGTGCRPGETELFKLKFSDVNWEDNEITFPGTKTGERKVPLKPAFVDRLRRAYKTSESDHIITYKGNPMKRMQRSFATALKNAGIKRRVRPYDIRHMYGTFMAKHNADVFVLQKLMGHADRACK